MAYFDGLTTTQVAALTTAQVAALTSTDLDSLTATQAPALTTTQLGALTTAAIPGFNTTNIAALTTTQIAALSTAQLTAIEFTDTAGLTTAQLAALTTVQMSKLSAEGVADLNLGYSANPLSGNKKTQSVIPPNPMPIAIPTGVTWSSGLFSFDGFTAAVAAILANRILTVTVQRYMDAAGLLPVGAAGTLTSTANTAGYTSALTTSVPAKYLKVTVANASGSTAIVSAFAIGIQDY